MRTIAVTGAASGIGAAIAARQVAEGNRVVGVDVQAADVVADLSTVDGRQAAVDGVLSATGGVLDGLVVCAGLAGSPHRPGSLLASVNYFGSVELLAALRPALAAGTDPAAVAISSNSTTCQPGVPLDVVDACVAGDEQAARAAADAAGSMMAYPATKIAIARYVRRNAPQADWGGAGIRLNAVAPGMIETPLVEEGRNDPEIAPLLDLFPLPLGRAGQPEEIAALVALLLGPEGRFFCGSVLFCDGGTDALLRPDDWPAPWDLDLGAAAAAFGEG